MTDFRQIPALLIGALSVLCGCIREPVEVECLEADALVITELRLEQGAGSYREWIELYNASDAPLVLNGLSVEVENPTNFRIERQRLLIANDEPLELAPGAYAAFGEWTEASSFLVYDYNRPYEVIKTDYDEFGNVSVKTCGAPSDEATTGDEDTAGSLNDGCYEDHRRVTNDKGALTSTLFADNTTDGTIWLKSCGATIYRRKFSLPASGTLVLNGALDPAEAAQELITDASDAWCIDTRPTTIAAEVGIRGTPGEANPSCDELADASGDPDTGAGD